jgi:predicted nucleic acid-binding protein
MARAALVLDASVAVKWFSPENEAGLESALAIRDAHLSGEALILVPDLFYYEVINAIAGKKFFSPAKVATSAAALFALGLQTAPADSALLVNAGGIARQFGITVYDAAYLAVARQHNYPLVTANPKHQRPDLGCRVIPLEEWKIQE